jgi:hypothetical protein
MRGNLNALTCTIETATRAGVSSLVVCKCAKQACITGESDEVSVYDRNGYVFIENAAHCGTSSMCGDFALIALAEYKRLTKVGGSAPVLAAPK